MATEAIKSSLCDTSKQVDKLISQHWSCIDPKAFELVKDLRHYSTECLPSQLTTYGLGRKYKSHSYKRVKILPILKTIMYENCFIS